MCVCVYIYIYIIYQVTSTSVVPETAHCRMTLFLRSFLRTSTRCVVVVVDVVVLVFRDADMATLLSAEELSTFESFRDASAADVTVVDSFLTDDAATADSAVTTASAGATWMLRVRFALISPLELLTMHLYRPACSVVAFWNR
jgi:hypothetical protein